MASTFKNLSPNDKVSTKTLLHEAIPLTGTILSGTYGSSNIKNYSHGMFQSVYDYPYLSSSANHIFDITFGISNNSALSSSTTNQRAKKINIYNQMAQVLVGYDKTGSIQQFDEDGDLADGTKLKECIFLNFSRLLVKDEIKKGSLSMTVAVTGAYSPGEFGKTIEITDYNAQNSYKINSPVGEYGILYATGSYLTSSALSSVSGLTDRAPCGLVYYQAGVAVLSSSVFTSGVGGILDETLIGTGSAGILEFNTNISISGSLTGSAISASADLLRNRIQNIQFNNTVELNSTIYFCRVNHNEYNYSANPTYLSSSQIRVKSESTDSPVSYITTVGLYSTDNQLLAVGKLSEPLKKDPTVEYTLRARLDY